MEPISISVILFNIIFGVIIGLITWASKDLRLIAIIQISGIVIFFLQIWPYFPSGSITDVPDISKMTSNVTNIIYLFVAYIVPDAAFSAGFSIFVKNSKY
jgi:hypothetical protein